jgi:hypothetical protein
MAKRRSILTAKEKGMLAKVMSRSRQMREDFAAPNLRKNRITGQMEVPPDFVIAAVVAREHMWLALELLPKILAALGEEPVAHKPELLGQTDEVFEEVGQ